VIDYQSFEQFVCKLTASNDFISQAACLVNFEAQYPPGSFNPDAILWVIGGLVCLIAYKSHKNGGLWAAFFGRRLTEHNPRIEPRL
jgi:hypothetical protein